MSPVNTQYALAREKLANYDTAAKVQSATFDKLFEAAGLSPDKFLNFTKGAIIVGYVRMTLGLDKNNTH